MNTSIKDKTVSFVKRQSGAAMDAFKRRVSRQTRVAFSILGGGLLCSSLVIATSPQHAPEELEEKSWPVTSMAFEAQSLSPVLNLYGKVSTPRKAHLTAALSANVDRVLVDDGEEVLAGDLLIQLDDRDARLDVKQAAAELNNMRAQLARLNAQHQADVKMLHHQKELTALAEKKIERYAQLQSDQLLSAAVLDEARSHSRQQAIALEQQQIIVTNFAHAKVNAEAAIEMAQVKHEHAKLTLSRTRIEAPFAGLVTGLAVAPGDRVNTGHGLLGLIDTSNMEVRAAIAGKYIAGLRARLDAGLPVTAQAVLDGRSVSLALRRLTAEVASGRSGVEGIFRVLEEGSAITLGRVVNLALQLPPEASVAAVPVQAVYDNQRVYVIENERLRGVEVEVVGERVDEQGEYQILIRSNELELGQSLMTSQLSRAITGLKVNLLVGEEETPEAEVASGQVKGDSAAS